MADLQVANITANAAGVVGPLSSAEQAFQRLDVTMNNLAKTTQEFNSKTGRVKATIEEMLDATTKLTTTVTENAKTGELQATALKKVTDGFKAAAAAAKEFQNAANAAAKANIASVSNANRGYGESQLRAMFPAPSAQNIAGLVTYQNNLNKVLNLMSSGKVSAEEFNAVIGKIKSGDNNLTGFSDGMTKAYGTIQKLNGELKNTGILGNQAGLTFKNVVNISEALVLKEIVSFITGEIRRSVSEASQLQIRISEIRTVAQGTGNTFKEWSDSITRVSNKTGVKADDIAEGAYQSLSNQTTTGTKDTEAFTTAAAELARVTMSTTKDAVNILASSMNTYGKSAEDAEKISATMFKTIQVGRLRLGDLGETFGRIAQPSAAIGLTLEETGAAIATLTKQGVPAHDAMTQLLNIETALLKPTGELKALMESWGTPTIQAANATFTFAGVLKKLNDEVAKGTSPSLQELFPNQRGLRGAMGLTQGGQFDKYQETLGEIQNAGSGDYDNAKDIRAESDADKVKKQLNEISNFFLHDFGDTILKYGADIEKFLEHLGATLKSLGFENMASSFGSVAATVQTLGRSLEVVGGMLLAYGGAWGAVKVATSAWNVVSALSAGLQTRLTVSTVAATGSEIANTAATVANTAAKEANVAVSASTGLALGSMIPVLGGVAAGLYLLHEHWKTNQEDMTQYHNTLQRVVEEQKILDKQNRDKSTGDDKTKFKSQNDADYASAGQKGVVALQALNAELLTFKNNAKETADELDVTFKTYTDALKDETKEFSKQVEETNRSIADTKRGFQTISDSLDKKAYNFAYGLANPYEKQQLDLARINELYAKQDQLLAQIKAHPDDVSENLSKKKEIGKYTEEILDLTIKLNQEYVKQNTNLTKNADIISQREGLGKTGYTNTDPSSAGFGKYEVTVRNGQFANNVAQQAANLKQRQLEIDKQIDVAMKGQNTTAKESLELARERDRLMAKIWKEYEADLESHDKAGKVKSQYQVGGGNTNLDQTKYDAKIADDLKRFKDAQNINVRPNDLTDNSKKQLVDALQRQLDVDLKFKDELGNIKKQWQDSNGKLDVSKWDQQIGKDKQQLQNAKDQRVGAHHEGKTPQEDLALAQKTEDAKLAIFKKMEDEATAYHKEAVSLRAKQALEAAQLQSFELKKEQEKAYNDAKDVVKKGAGIPEDLDKIQQNAQAIAQATKDASIAATTDPRDLFGIKSDNPLQDMKLSAAGVFGNEALAKQVAELVASLKDKDHPLNADKRGEAMATLQNAMQLMSGNLTAVLNARQQYGGAKNPNSDPNSLKLPDGATTGNLFATSDEKLKQIDALQKQLDAAEAKIALFDSTSGKGGAGLADRVASEGASQLITKFATDFTGSGLVKASNDLAGGFAKLQGIIDGLKGPTNQQSQPNLQGGNGAPNFNGTAAPGTGGGPIPGNAAGGMIVGPNGVDVIPRMLTAGEYVMPVAQTQAFLPLLKAMHMGRIPMGVGSNVSTVVGDINITVEGPATPDKTIRQLGESLRREIRRGNITLQ